MKKKVQKFSIKKIIIMIVLLLAFTLGSSTLAKYVIQEFHSYYLSAKHFYFTSNRLKRNNPTYLVNNWSGVGSFNISFDLSSEKNSYVYTESDISYEVSFTCPNDVTCSLDKTSGVIYNASTGHSDTVTLSVVPTRNYNENERLNIVIEARSTSPYEETIKATFAYVVGKQGITYEIDDENNRTYMLLKITNAINYCKVIEAFDGYQVNDLIESSIYRSLSAQNKAKCVGEEITLNFDPHKVILDTTSDIVNYATYSSVSIDGTDYINQLTFNIEPVSTMAIKFYKIDTTKNYTYPFNNNSSIVGVVFS